MKQLNGIRKNVATHNKAQSESKKSNEAQQKPDESLQV